MEDLQNYFDKFRRNIIGNEQIFESPYGSKKILYADWVATGRLYAPIENKLKEDIAPFMGNTHTETSVTGTVMTMAYHNALKMIKQYVGANHNDVIISRSSGMTGVINKFQRMLGLRLHEKYQGLAQIPDDSRPIVFVTHMEHHSNQTSWLETIADLEVIDANEEGLVDLSHLEKLLEKYKNRKHKIAAVTSCSNVTGILTPYYQVAEIMHNNGGLCFVDFAASAPYIEINMHPENPLQSLDAIYFSPHKFLGGPGSSGILIFNSKLYKNTIPDHPGGGTVLWTNPWGFHKYIDDIEAREDGGTPAILQTIKVALAMKLKEDMGTQNILNREKELLEIVWANLSEIENLHILAGNIKERLGIISFLIEGLHYNLAVSLLNDRFGIQMRGGCVCAGTYGHYLFEIIPDRSNDILNKIITGDLSEKPGLIRFSLHPTMTKEEVIYICDAIRQVAENFKSWGEDYIYDTHTNEFVNKQNNGFAKQIVDSWLL